MKIALYKMPYLKDVNTAHPFCVDKEPKDWVRVSEVVDIDFQMIDVDWEAQHKAAIQASVDELEKRLAEVRASL